MITTLTILSGTTSASPASAIGLSLSQTASNATITPTSGNGVTLPAATSGIGGLAGLLDNPRATIIDTLAPVASSGLYSSLTGAPSSNQGFNFIIDGGGAPITTGLKGFLIIPNAFTLIFWNVAADQTGSITIDIWKTNNAIPGSGNSITGGNPIALSSSQFSGGFPVGWGSVNFTVNDVVGFNVNSTGGVIQRITIALQGTHL